MKRLALFAVPLGLLLSPLPVTATVNRRIPVVTQIQGAVLYRTSVTIGNGRGSGSTPVVMRLTYRSPVDGSLQAAFLSPAGPLSGRRVLVYEDIIQSFKDAGSIRAADLAATLFGTLLVSFEALDNVEDAIVVARTYSAATGGGTNGIAYVGVEAGTAGDDGLLTAVRNGAFGTDGTTRANIGFVNEHVVATDVEVTYFDGTTGAQLKQFTLSQVTQRPTLSAGEVYQLNNIFNDSAIPAGTRLLVIRVRSLASQSRISGYVVQLDSITNDGSFFLMNEPDDCSGYTPPF